jgi:hypothetical protein|tara:strand:+ start:176 stop:337 length:162 start_codon:yes stop_codon:yes gene_type:complete
MTPYDAFVMALVLALEAPTDRQAGMAAEIAEDLANQLTSLQIDQGKKEALDRV